MASKGFESLMHYNTVYLSKCLNCFDIIVEKVVTLSLQVKSINIYAMDLDFFALAIGVLSIAGSAVPVVVAILLLRK